MKNKIVGICICMLLIATAVPSVTSVKNNEINATVPSTPQTSMAGVWTETQKLFASDGAAGDTFGDWIAFEGDTALIGAFNDDSGSVYVFTRTGTTWTQQQKLVASDGQAGDSFGSSISLSGDTALIGARWDDDNGNKAGSAYVFIRSGTTWTQQAKLLASDGEAEDRFGGSVSLDGDTAIIGAWFDNDNGNGSGSAYVFTRTGTTWTQQQKLLASDGQEGDDFGDVSLSGDTALIGAALDDDNGVDSGSAYIFTRSGITWTQQAKLLASDGAAGDQFSRWAVSLDGDTALIGAEGDDDNGGDSGSAYVFIRTGTTWTQQAKLLASDGAAGDYFGNSISLSGDTALIGAPTDDDKGTNSGSAYVFTRSGTTWTQQQKLLASDGAAGDQFGYPVFLSSDTALIAALNDDDNGINSGSAYVFQEVNEPPLDVPVWEVGDSWTYNEQYHQIWYKTDGNISFIWYHNCTSTYTVTDDTGDSYAMKLTSKNNEGSLTLGKFRLKFTPFTKLTQEMEFRKTDLAYVNTFKNQEKGLVIWLLGTIGLPIPAQYSDIWDSTGDPQVFLPFPLTAGTTGTLPSYTAAGHEKMSLYWGLIKFIDADFSYEFPALDYHCQMANITVPAGTYDTYNVSTDVYYGSSHNYSWTYYLPEAGFYAKQSIHSDWEGTGKLTAEYNFELVSTTYKP
jgi:hypothetical protein